MSKNILLVGGSSGIGNEIFRNLHPVHRVITLHRSAWNENNDHYTCDVLSGPLPDLSEPVHGLVYCPGSINLKPFHMLSEKDFLNDFNINVMGAVRVLKKYMKNLQESGMASVVLFSTVAVVRGVPYHAAIASAKGAVEGLVRSLAAELAPSVRVNAIAPSLTDTPLAVKLLRSDKQREAAAERHPLKRTGLASDIAGAAKYLLSDESSWVTGQVLHVDGGLSSLT